METQRVDTTAGLLRVRDVIVEDARKAVVKGIEPCKSSRYYIHALTDKGDWCYYRNTRLDIVRLQS